jgi:hypothetical protein
VNGSERRRQLLTAYEERRISDQLAYHQRRLKVSQHARRQLLDSSTFLYTMTALLGAMAASSIWCRAAWAVLAAATGATASALTGYAMMAGFERSEQQSRQVVAALSLLEVSRPEPPTLDAQEGDKVLADYVTKVESLLQEDVELWARTSADAATADADKQKPDEEQEDRIETDPKW